MRTVTDDTGRHLLLIAESSDASRVRDPETGEEFYVENDRLSHVDGESTFETVARSVDEPVRKLLSAVHTEWALGLLIHLDENGPVSARELMETDDKCESTLYGTISEFRAAGLVVEADVFGERGYRTTERASAALHQLRG
ncbi:MULTISPECIES: hypothetical protein [unclassified Haladaptatus]|uniref:DUF7346 family protein n=1 Tax=unclassified Haladaptatus TaxID=2622732 RepID=UPI0023E80F4B|nr:MULTISPECIES: hypothetical protein [unclassified Haladaptatus]